VRRGGRRSGQARGVDGALQLRGPRLLRGRSDALLDEGDVEGAWNLAHEDPDRDLGFTRRLRLAEACEAQRPEEALPRYVLVADELLLETGRRAYARAIPVLKGARRAADAAGRGEWFAGELAGLRERHSHRPTLLAMLAKAGLG
jgi:uncharacterized Zn finger protein